MGTRSSPPSWRDVHTHLLGASGVHHLLCARVRDQEPHPRQPWRLAARGPWPWAHASPWLGARSHTTHPGVSVPSRGRSPSRSLHRLCGRDATETHIRVWASPLKAGPHLGSPAPHECGRGATETHSSRTPAAVCSHILFGDVEFTAFMRMGLFGQKPPAPARWPALGGDYAEGSRNPSLGRGATPLPILAGAVCRDRPTRRKHSFCAAAMRQKRTAGRGPTL